MSEQNLVTLGKEAKAELTEKKSVFIGHAAPVRSAEEAENFVLGIRKKHADARHNVFAYTVGSAVRCSDDGEPKGTGGVPVLEVLKKSALPFLLIYRKHLEKESDCIMIDEADEGRKIAEYAKSMGHRNILFLYKTDPKIQLEENTPYTNAMRKLFDLPADQPVPATHLLHFTGLREFVRKPEFRKFTMIYSSGSIARQVMQVLKEAGISVPDDLSYLVYGKAFPGFFNGRTPSAVSIRNNLENAIFDWLDLRFWQKNRNTYYTKCKN